MKSQQPRYFVMKLLPVLLQQYHWFIFVNLHAGTFNCHFTYLPNAERCFRSRLRNTLWYFSSLSISRSTPMYLIYMSRSVLLSLLTRCSPVMSSRSTISICKKKLVGYWWVLSLLTIVATIAIAGRGNIGPKRCGKMRAIPFLPKNHFCIIP